MTPYLALYRMTARELGERIREDVVETTGIPATCGLGTNLYLAKVALDITAKHSPDFFGELNEETYRETLWNHPAPHRLLARGPGTAAASGGAGHPYHGRAGARAHRNPSSTRSASTPRFSSTMRGASSPCSISDIKAYKPQTHCLTNAQVLRRDYPFEEARTVIKEMADAVSLELVEQEQGCGLGGGVGRLWPHRRGAKAQTCARR